MLEKIPKKCKRVRAMLEKHQPKVQKAEEGTDGTEQAARIGSGIFKVTLGFLVGLSGVFRK